MQTLIYIQKTGTMQSRSEKNTQVHGIDMQRPMRGNCKQVPKIFEAWASSDIQNEFKAVRRLPQWRQPLCV